MKLQMFTSAAALALSLSAGGGVAFAQTSNETAAESDIEISDEIVVTARFRAESAQDIGASIRGIGGDDIAQAGMTDFQDLARRTPGVQLLDRGPNQNEIAIRGISRPITAASTDTFTARGVVTTFLDDVLVSTQSGNERDFNLFDLNRVEILRGPQPTYFGEGSVGGTIRYFTSDPSLDGGIGGILSATASSTDDGGDNTNFQGSVDFTLIPDQLGVRVTGFQRSDEGFIDNTTLGQQDVNFLDSEGGRIVVLARPTPALSIRLFANAADDDSGAQWSIQPNSDPGALRTNAPVRGQASDSYELYGAKIDYDFGPITLTSITGSYTRERQSLFYDPTFTAQVNFLYGGFGLTNPVTTRSLGFTDDNFTQEFRLASDFDGPLNFTAGLFYKDGTFISNFAALTPGIAAYTSPSSTVLTAGVTHFDTEQTSAFGELTWDVTERLRLIAGARYVSETQTARFDPNGFVYLPALGNLPPNVHPTVNGTVLAFAGLSTTFDLSLDRMLPRVAIEYDVTPDILAYVSASEGIRNGSINPVVSVVTRASPGGIFNPTTFANFITYDDDGVRAYDAGLKTRWLDQRLTVNVGLFYNDWRDIQTVVGSPALIDNAGDARSYGVELETAYFLNENLSVYADAAYTSAEFNDTTVTGSGVIAEGNRLTSVPEFTFSAGADVSFPITSDFDLIGHLDYQYIGDRFTTAENIAASKLPSFSLVNLRAGLSNDTWSLVAFASNLTNEVEVQSSNVAPPFGVIEQFVNRPRTIGVELTLNY
ncbi:MAG: TonB-dependent receptor [Hyphomonadaceae bacterium]|nr:TonB-dependent receptor [Hyphomonadaceae bacterium]